MRTPAPSPVVGTLSDLGVDDGAVVREGDLVCCVESMKVMFQIYAPASGRVEYVVELGEIVAQEDAVFEVVTD